MGRHFGTDGFRGRVGETLTASHAYAIGRYLGHACRGGRVLVGRDTRRSGELLECALSAGVMATGADIFSVGVIPTAGLSYLMQHGAYDMGVMLTASHNPHTDNGIKLLAANGEKPQDALLTEVEHFLDGEGVTVGDADGTKVGKRRHRVREKRSYLMHLLSHGCCPLGGMRVGIDCAHGSASAYAGELFASLGATVTRIGASPNGVNINDGVGATHIEALAALVRARGLDVGFAFDGDADRCMAVDAQGRVVDGDGILYLSALDMRARGVLAGDCVVGTVLSGSGLEHSLGRAGITLVRAAVGDRHVWERMRACGAILGGERSGHVIYAQDAVTGDGLLTAVKVLGVIARRGCGLASLVRNMEVYPRVERNVVSADPMTLLEGAEVQRAISAAERRLAGRGRVLVRASGTEPLLRVMCEAEDEDLCRRCAELICEACGER